MDQVAATYEKYSKIYKADYKRLHSRANLLSLLRLITALLSLSGIYGYIQYRQLYLIVAAMAAAVVFFILLRIHQDLAWKKSVRKHLVKINREEKDFVERGTLYAEEGAEYIDASHPYTADLDVFGQRSLFQYLNRTTTYPGKTQLAQMLSCGASAERIKENQEAIAETAAGIALRQELMAIGDMANDDKAIYDRLIKWAAQPVQKIHTVLLVCCYLLTAALCLSLFLYLFTGNELFWDIALRIFPLNLVIFFTQVKKIRKELFNGIKIDELLKSYGMMLQHIAAAAYKSERLQALQRLIKETDSGKSIQKLAQLYSRLEMIENPFAMVFMNGLYFFHIHQLKKLAAWKSNHAADIKIWLEVIGELEALNSLGNFYYNNPSFCFPEINNEHIVNFEQLGHPLINAARRISNSVSFTEQNFIILTGSNMSGKSTFLRTLGINMVLAGSGAPVCAGNASICPMPILVSMRQTDSLADSESYFFAEVKRLRFIVTALDQQPCFILLDEILRGTNSDDKRSGTISVIKNIISKKAFGAIATHDLEVCLITEQYRDILTNKCFEVSIVNDELVFDYKLRDGICKNKSATFLMQKIGII